MDTGEKIMTAVGEITREEWRRYHRAQVLTATVMSPLAAIAIGVFFYPGLAENIGGGPAALATAAVSVVFSVVFARSVDRPSAVAENDLKEEKRRALENIRQI